MEIDEGQIVTFYSYKGGVGRSFALVNIAVLLARWGCRVLCVDWDLEAPGLHYYFRVEPEGGLLKLLTGLREGNRPDWRQSLQTLDIAGTDGRLDFLPAGKEDQAYIEGLQALDWNELYETYDVGSYIEEMRRGWQSDYDVVLVDSRTGITDSGAICTAQLPDVLVLVFTANKQGLSGLVEVVRRAERARQRLPYERKKLLLLPAVSRFDAREEYELAEQRKRQLADQLTPFFRAWLHVRSPMSRAVDLCTIPYVSKWSFGEQIAVLTEERRSPDFISYSLENIASLLALRFDRTDHFTESPDSYVKLAQRQITRMRQSRTDESSGRFEFDVFISHRHEPESDSSVQKVVEGLRRSPPCQYQ